MVILTPGDFIWIEEPNPNANQFSTPIGAKVLHLDNGQIFVVDDEGREIGLDAETAIRVMHPSSIECVEDLVDLGDLHEASILRNLLIRFREEKTIYTYVGSILLAINPHEQLPIYTIDFVRSYHKHRIGELPSHIFAIAENVYSGVCKQSSGQASVIISGESGSGKTESSKFVLHYLATACGQHSFVEQQLLEANPIIEAFGNACTAHNDNSSRFGKYTKIFIDENGHIKGARLTKFLLEKSRVVQQRIDERNFHIFYLLSHLTTKEKFELELDNSTNYHLLGEANQQITGQGDAELTSLRESLKILSFSQEEVGQIFALLASILHLGNLKYKNSFKDNIEITEIDDTLNINRVSKLLQIESKQLTKSLTIQSISVGKELIRRNLSSIQALNQRDSLIKAIYTQLFDYLIEFINETLGISLSEDECKPGLSNRNYRAIGILDIFGFENLRENSYEQLCINYANEIMQQIFTRQIFKLEQADYESQQIGWQNLDYVDNQPVINLLAGSHLGIFQLIDEESIFPKGNDESLLQKLHSNHSKTSSDVYMKPSSDLIKRFGVRHYVGGFVSYSMKDFLVKNRDHFGSDLRHLIGTSRCKLLRKIFNCTNHQLLQTHTETHKQTVGQSFRRSLETLVAELEHTDPFFIQCIRPNEQKLPNVFDRSCVLRQLRNLGLMQTTAIRRSGYSSRHDYKKFVETYYGLVPNLDTSNYIEASERILNVILGVEADFRLGKTKIFLKNNDDVFLQREREKMLNFYAISIQKNLRAYAKRRQFIIMRQSALIIQCNWRAYQKRKNYRQILDGIRRFQAILRSQQLVSRYELLREQVTQFQACCRGTLLRRRMEEGLVLEHSSLNVNSQEEEAQDCFEFLSNANEDTSENGSLSPTFQLNSNVDENSKFDRFAAIHFQGNADFRHLNRVLRSPLFSHQSVGDQMAALAIWIHILRFMRDLPEAEQSSEANGNNGIGEKQSIMTQLYAKIYKNAKEPQLIGSRSEKSLFKNKRTDSYDTFSRTSSKCSSSTTTASNTWFTNVVLDPIDRLNLIIGYGILRASLRDEIYAQIIKQLTNNPKKVSQSRGWILFSLCLGSFQPSEGFGEYVREFIDKAPVSIRDNLMKKFDRCSEKGTRRQPPSYLELQAIQSGKFISIINVTFMDGIVKTIQVDSSTTAQEVCVQLAERIELKDRFGFSLFITMGSKVTSLGAGNDFILDAISQFEQEAKCKGESERNAQWRLFYRKELFSPWNSLSQDPIATSLIYEQITRGLHYNEYRCSSEQELAILAAQQFFIQQGQCLMEADIIEKHLPSLLPEAIVTKTKEPLEIEKWIQLILNALRKTFSSNPQSTITSVKRDVCNFAMKRWPLLFSRFYEAYKFAGPPLPKNEVIIAINSTGFYVLNNEDQEILLEATFPQIMGIVSSLSKRMGTDAITIQLLNGDEYTFQSANAEDICKLVIFFLDGLRKRSKHLLVMNPLKKVGDQKWLNCKQGDLLKMLEEAENEKEDHVMVLNVRSDERGYLPKNKVYIIPCIDEPPQILLEQVLRHTELKAEDTVETIHQQIVPVFNNCTLDLMRLQIFHTLQKFGLENFRPNDSPRELWNFSHEPLRRPLLIRTEARLEVLESYVGLMKFMGDMPMLEPFHPVELTNQIFGPPIKFPNLRDEIYCQLMKQLTDNPSQMSEERGWKLMWLITGLFAPSRDVHGELVQFLNTRRSAKTSECLLRLNKTMRCGQNTRKHPPHQVEVDAIFSRTTQIFHKVFLPDGSNEAVEVGSNSKSEDLCKQLGSILGFKSVEGFSLFVKLGEKAVSVPNEEFFFDFITQVTQWSRQNQPTKQATSTMAYQIIFMRKLWIGVRPGFDSSADLFHYYQEIPKYLHGFYNVTKGDVVKLAALILKAQTKDNKEPPFGHFQQIIMDLIPKDMLKQHSGSEWKKLITAEYVNVTAKNAIDAKTQFLKAISQFPTFGSAFFEVKQTSDPTMPPRVIIAINQHGVSVYDQANKRQLINYPFNIIVNWTAGNTYFHLCVGNIVKGSRLLVETTLGYKMDDLIASYLQQLLYDPKNARPSITSNAYIEHK